MKHQVTLTITSLLSILLFSLHWADEVARGIEPGTVAAFGGLLILGPSWVDPCVWRPCPPHAGGGTCRRPDRPQLQRRPLLGLDEHRAWRVRNVVVRALGARTVEPETGPAEV